MSLEVSPYLARDTRGSISEARRLYKLVKKLNCFIKIPGTKEGVPAIEQLLYEGINVNVTLLFSIDSYTAVAKAYISALKRRAADGKDIKNTISVASFFISRIDVLTDQLLGQYMSAGNTKANDTNPALLMGKAGIASAKLAYQRFKEIFSGAEWEALKQKGAHVQRPLWASTSNKDPLKSDVRYVEELMGQDTVNTLPDETIAAFADHGQLKKDSIAAGLDEAGKIFGALKRFDIDIDFITQQLEYDGIQKFIEPYNKLISGLAEKRNKIMDSKLSAQQINGGALKKEIEAAYDIIDQDQAGRRLFNKDPYLWKTAPDQVKTIQEGLGWLNLPQDFTAKCDDLKTFTDKIKSEGYKHAVLLGMGGSSLCSEVARETFGTSDGYLKLLVLDNTEPEAILDVQNQVDLEKTIFIAATKSGGTMETLSFFKYFYEELKKKGSQNPGKNFIAITDPGSPLVPMAEEYKFRRTFLNPTDVGGRYSVLSYFGILPMALMGIDVKEMLARALQMETSCGPEIPAASNPGISLGTTLGICQKNGRDKVTFVMSSSISAFGYWVEQLLAESTGKEGKGLIPVNGETIGAPEVYGKDRIFIYMHLASDDSKNDEEKLKALEAAGHPVVRINVADKLALGGEYYRWEVATAIAGMVIGINAFDQPNVAESKKNTNNLLDEWKQKGDFQKPTNDFKIGDYTVYAGNANAQLKDGKYSSVEAVIEAFSDLAKPGDYVAMLPYFKLTDERNKILQSWREKIRDKHQVATTLLNGPRYLHSTGQLHKGGPDTGLYLMIVGPNEKEIPIPGEKFGFATLHEAQSLGDYRSLNDKGRRLILINIGDDIDKGLAGI